MGKEEKVSVSVSRDGWAVVLLHLGNSENSATYTSRELNIPEVDEIIKAMQKALLHMRENREENYEAVIGKKAALTSKAK